MKLWHYILLPALLLGSCTDDFAPTDGSLQRLSITFDEEQPLARSYWNDRTPEEELLDVYFDMPRPVGKETRTVHFLTTSEIQAKLISYGNLHRPIPLRTLCQILDNKGYQRMRNGNRRGYLVVELEATEINSRRMMVSADMPF